MLSFIKNIGLIEICLIQTIFYACLWFIDEYFAILMTSIMVVIIFAILVISLISELLERSKVPRSFFKIMAASVIIPLLVAIVYGSTSKIDIQQIIFGS